jgi:gamma-glutamylcyclotransferase (GGCT)/AIG2-like uncharacterized protein YtfP
MISSRQSRRDSLLFVYGTLRPFVDIEMATWLRGAARYLGPATTPGRLYDLGAYPGMLAARARGERVVGDVYRVTNPRVWRVLDAYEAGDRGKARFVRERCVVDLVRGGRRVAWAYRYRYSVVAAARIARGDYRVHRRATNRCAAGRRYVAGLRFATIARRRR